MWGLDLLGLAKYPDVARREFPAGWALGAFAETFGDAAPAIEGILATKRCPLVRVQMIWSDTHEFGDSDIPTLERLADVYNKMAARYPEIEFQLSPFCEHNIDKPDKYLNIVKAAAPLCRPINTPWKGAISGKFWNEVHGTHEAVKNKPYQYSYDGTASVDADVTQFKNRYRFAKHHFFWTYQFNGKKNSNDTTPRPERQAWPTSQLIDSVIYLHNRRMRTQMPERWLWKSHADQHNAPIPEQRALKPVLITPQKVKEYELVADNGQVIAAMSYYGPFADGRHRYYADRFGYELSEKAKRIQGHPVVRICHRGETLAKVNPAFRDGEYRS